MPPVATVHDSLMTNGASSGGPAGLLYGFIVVWAGTAAVFTTLSELASMYAQLNTSQLLLSLAGHLPREASITGSPYSHHNPHESSSATSQVGSNHFDQVLRALMIYRLAHSLGVAGQCCVCLVHFREAHPSTDSYDASLIRS